MVAYAAHVMFVIITFFTKLHLVTKVMPDIYNFQKVSKLPVKAVAVFSGLLGLECCDYECNADLYQHFDPLTHEHIPHSQHCGPW